MPSQVLDHVVDALGEGHDISRFHRGEHANAQLVAAQLAVAGGVHNVTTAFERASASTTNGAAYSERSAHEYRMDADLAQRVVAQARPPLLLSQRIWFSIMIRVATAGVFRV